MRRSLVTAWLVARVWGVATLAVGVVLEVAVVRFVRGPVGLPGRSELRSLLWPLAPVLPVSLLPGVLRRQRSDLDQTSPRSPPGRRGVLVLSAAAVLASAVVVAPAAMRGVLARNTLLLGAVAVATSGVASAEAGGIALVALGVASWFLGARPAGAAPATWAVLYQPAGGRPVPLAAALVLALLSAGWYACCGSGVP